MGENGGDPRPELVRDSPLWARLLQLARRDCPDLWGPLHGIRCLGARLERGKRGFRIASDYDGYAQDRETWLLPHRAELSELLAKLIPPQP